MATMCTTTIDFLARVRRILSLADFRLECVRVGKRLPSLLVRRQPSCRFPH